MQHIRHVKLVFDCDYADIFHLSPYKDLIRAIAEGNSELLDLTTVFKSEDGDEYS